MLRSLLVGFSLDTRSLLLEPDYIYLDPDTWEFSFCFFPFYEGDMENGLLELSEYLLDRQSGIVRL